MFVFSTRTIWLELDIPLKSVFNRYSECFGHKNKTLDKETALTLLIDITTKLQEKIMTRFASTDTRGNLKALYKIFDEVQRFYIRQKKARHELMRANISEGEVVNVFEINRNISRNIIDATNIWIENCVLHQNLKSDYKENSSFDLDHDLLIDIYIYGLASQAVSLLNLSKNETKDLFYGLKLTPTDDIPAEVLKDHPMIYFNPLLTGNQNILSDEQALADAGTTHFGVGFKSEYGVDFLYFLAVLHYFQTNILANGKIAFTVIDFKDFLETIEMATTPKINAQSIVEHFTITKTKLAEQLRVNEPIIWKIGVNKIRHELCPFIVLENERVYISYCILEQAKQLWVSYFLNGGMCYTNKKDALTQAIDKRNDELSKELVNTIREKLRSHYFPDFDEIEVDYRRIFGDKPIGYGDFDLVFYNREVNELFLIEAKFFSDSLTSSAVVTDYEKLFKKYYDRCRRRYDIVLSEPEKMKRFVNTNEVINVHFLFVTSKPIEIEIQDDDGIVTFLSLNIFDKYLEGKLINGDDDCIFRPMHQI